VSRLPAARLACFLLLPLAAWPGLGYDTVRLPLALAAAALLCFGPAVRPGLVFVPLAGFVAYSFLRAAPGIPILQGGLAALAGTVGLSAYLAARTVADRRFVPWVLAALGAALGLAAPFGREAFEGNPNYAGVVAALLVPPLAALAGGEGGRLRAAALAGLAGAAFALVVSESRAGLLAAVLGLGVVGWLTQKRSGRRAAFFPAAVAVLLLAVPLLARTARFVSAERMATASVRTEIWKGAWRMTADRPWRGVGVAGFAAEFPPYRSPKEAAITYRDAGPGEYREVEDAHSTWLHVLAETGFPGLLFLLAALVLAGRAVVRGVRSPGAGPLEVGLAGLVAAFVLAATFNTLHARVSPWVLFWTAVGLIEGPAAASKAWPAVLAAILAMAPAAPLTAWGKVWHGEVSYWEGRNAADRDERVRLLKEAAWGFRGWEAQFLIGVEALAAGDLEEAEKRFEFVSHVRRHHGGAMVNWAVVRLRRGVPRPEVERFLLAIRTASPHYYATEFNLGNLAALDGRWNEARERFRAAQSLHPRHAGSAYGEGAAWIAEGKIDDALPALRRARELGMDVGVALRGDFPALSGEPRLGEFSW
jgi:hypothetical protein